MSGIKFIKIAACDDEPSVKIWEIFIEYDKSVVRNLSRFISYLARDTHSYYGDASRAGQRSLSRVLSRRSIIVTISWPRSFIGSHVGGVGGERVFVLEDDSTSDCINGTVECLCLDLVAETAHILTHCALALLLSFAFHLALSIKRYLSVALRRT